MRNLLWILIFYSFPGLGQRGYDSFEIPQSFLKYEISFDTSSFQPVGIPDTLRRKSGEIEGIGHFAFDQNGNKTPFKVGQWQQYSPQGQLESVGSYGIQRILTCSGMRSLALFSSYRVGSWKYYYPNGSIKAEGTFKIKKIKTYTGIEDQYVFKPITTKQWIYLDLYGQQLENRAAIAKEIEDKE